MASGLRPFSRPLTYRALLLLLVTFATLIGACFEPQPLPGYEPPASMTPAPLEREAFNSPLTVEPQQPELWRVASIVQNGEVLQFEELGPVFSWISTTGLGVITLKCTSGGWGLTLVGEGHYVLGDGDFSTKMCEEPQDILNTQSGAVFDAFQATDRYEFRDGKLILSGESVRIVLDPSNIEELNKSRERVNEEYRASESEAFNGPLTVEPQWPEMWRVASIMQEGEELQLAELGPVYVEIYTTSLGVTTIKCQTGGWPLSLIGDGHYVKGEGAFTANECEEPQDMLDPQAQAVFEAFRNTDRYEFQDGRLILSGDNVRIVLDPSSFMERNESRELVEEE